MCWVEVLCLVVFCCMVNNISSRVVKKVIVLMV